MNSRLDAAEYSTNRTGLFMVAQLVCEAASLSAISTRMAAEGDRTMFSNTYRRNRGLGSFSFATGLALGMLALSGCRSDAQTGALLGSGIGAGIGGIIGHNVNDRGIEGALIGAGVGALGGYVVGNEADKERHWRRSNYDY
jgi:hypothetical protein